MFKRYAIATTALGLGIMAAGIAFANRPHPRLLNRRLVMASRWTAVA